MKGMPTRHKKANLGKRIIEWLSYISPKQCRRQCKPGKIQDYSQYLNTIHVERAQKFMELIMAP